MGQDHNVDQTPAPKVSKLVNGKSRITAAGYLWIVSMAALGSWVAVMASDRRPATEYIGTPIIIPDPVEDGGRVVVDLPIRRNKNCPGVVQRRLRNDDTKTIIAFYDPIPAAFPMHTGVQDKLPKTFDLPRGLPPRVVYEADVCFQCNLLQHFFPVCTSVPPVTFGIIQPRQ